MATLALRRGIQISTVYDDHRVRDGHESWSSGVGCDLARWDGMVVTVEDQRRVGAVVEALLPVEYSLSVAGADFGAVSGTSRGYCGER